MPRMPKAAAASRSSSLSPIMKLRARSIGEIARRLFEQAGLRLAAIAGDGVTRDRALRMMRAIIERVDAGAGGGELPPDLVVETLDVVLAVIAARDARLVGDDDRQEAGVVQQPHRLGRAGDQVELLETMHVAVVDIEHAVAIEEGGRACLAHGRTSSASGAVSPAVVNGRRLRPLAIQTTPPMAPTAKLTSPNRIDNVSPSLCARPA